MIIACENFECRLLDEYRNGAIGLGIEVVSYAVAIIDAELADFILTPASNLSVSETSA